MAYRISAYNHFIMKTILYGSWILGVFPYTIDHRMCRVRPSRCLQLYGVLVCFGLISACLYTKNFEPKDLEIFEKNMMTQQLTNLLEVVTLLAITVNYLQACWRGINLSNILSDLWLIKNLFAKEFKLINCSKFDRYVAQEGLVILMEISSELVIFSALFQIPENVTEIIFSLLLGFGALLTQSQFHLVLLFIQRITWYLNRSLLMIVRRLSRGLRVDPHEVGILLGTYERLVTLNNSLTSIYDIQITLGMAIMFIFNISEAHKFIISMVHSTWSMILIACHVLIINTWDLWQGIAICHSLETEGRKTASILKLFAHIGSLDRDMERVIDAFSLLCSHRRIKVRCFCSYEVNYETGFRLIIRNILFVLFLAQIDYANLKRK